MKFKNLLKSFYIIIIFIIVCLFVVLCTNLYFDYKYINSPTFLLIKFTGINIIITHIVFNLILIFFYYYKDKFNFYITLIVFIFISLILQIYFFYDFII
jgi:hypothetical protein